MKSTCSMSWPQESKLCWKQEWRDKRLNLSLNEKARFYPVLMQEHRNISHRWAWNASNNSLLVRFNFVVVIVASVHQKTAWRICFSLLAVKKERFIHDVNSGLKENSRRPGVRCPTICNSERERKRERFANSWINSWLEFRGGRGKRSAI